MEVLAMCLWLYSK